MKGRHVPTSDFFKFLDFFGYNFFSSFQEDFQLGVVVVLGRFFKKVDQRLLFSVRPPVRHDNILLRRRHEKVGQAAAGKMKR